MEKPVRRRAQPHQAVLKAAFELLRTVGYAAVTMDKLAQAAGVGKPTLYRWWSSKAEILLEAAVENAKEALPPPDTGSLAGDLTAYLGGLFVLLNAGGDAVARSLIAEAGLDEAFALQFRRSFIAARRAEVCLLLKRGRAAGELVSEVSDETLVDAFFGPVWYRLLLHETLDAPLVTDLVSLFLGGAAPPDLGRG